MSKTFGRVLKYCRRLGGKTQLELALDAGVSARHLSFLESGRAEPGRDVVARLAEALEISLPRATLCLLQPGSRLRQTPRQWRQGVCSAWSECS